MTLISKFIVGNYKPNIMDMLTGISQKKQRKSEYWSSIAVNKAAG